MQEFFFGEPDAPFSFQEIPYIFEKVCFITEKAKSVLFFFSTVGAAWAHSADPDRISGSRA
jgi:hypothetical protein